MRARTPMLLLFVYAACAPHVAHAAVISARTGIEPPFLRPTGSRVPVNDPQYFLAPGAVSSISVAPESRTGFSGDEQFYLQLTRFGDTSTPLDCRTPTKSVDDWGISHVANDPDPPTVVFGPFAGSECAIMEASSGDPISATLYTPDGALVASGIGWAFNANGYNFSVEGGDAQATTTEGSSVLFLPGTAASRLYTRAAGIEVRAWEPDNALDVTLLAMAPGGSSEHEIYTKDIIDSLYSGSAVEHAIAQAFGPNDLDIYGSFEQFMDQLVTAGSIREWRAYPYDWRYDPLDIVQRGTRTELPDGSLQTVFLQDVLAEMASSSPTGKVTIVAHSNGGLLAKALAASLGDSANRYIDRIILVGTPQYGTPQDIGAMLHGDGETYAGGLVLYGGTARAATQDMPGLYTLLPSAAYFGAVHDAPVLFTDGAATNAYAGAYGASVADHDSLERFLSNSVGASERADTTNIAIPLALPSDFLRGADTTHEVLDAWTPPAGVTLTIIAGTDQPTISSLVYSTESSAFTCDRNGLFSLTNCGFGSRLAHSSLETSQGDGTVVAQSAIGNAANPWYFDTGIYANESGENIVHRELMSALPIQKLIETLLTGTPMTPDAALATALPPSAGDGSGVVVEVDSPGATVTAADGSGNESGAVQVPGADGISIEKNDSHGVSVHGGKVTVPSSGTYKVEVKNTASGSDTKVKVTKDESGVASSTEYLNIPTTASTTITVQVHDGEADPPVVDEYGNGLAVFVIGPDGTDAPTLSIPEQLHALFAALNVRPGIKNRLLRALEPLEADETDQSAVASLEILIKAQTGVKLSLDQGAQMLALLYQLKQ